jgi:hypothetical protein
MSETTPANTHRRFVCKCECGNESIVERNHLLDGHTTSCGCFMRELNEKLSRVRATVHGLSGTPEYAVFSGLKSRCQNPKDPNYMDYGGRGIKTEWNSVEEFLSDMGPRPFPAATLDRKDGNGNYSKDNCRWATQLQQQNNRRNNVFYDLNGDRKTLAEWCRELGLNRNRVEGRLRKGLEFERIATELREEVAL